MSTRWKIRKLQHELTERKKLISQLEHLRRKLFVSEFDRKKFNLNYPPPRKKVELDYLLVQMSALCALVLFFILPLKYGPMLRAAGMSVEMVSVIYVVFAFLCVTSIVFGSLWVGKNRRNALINKIVREQRKIIGELEAEIADVKPSVIHEINEKKGQVIPQSLKPPWSKLREKGKRNPLYMFLIFASGTLIFCGFISVLYLIVVEEKGTLDIIANIMIFMIALSGVYFVWWYANREVREPYLQEFSNYVERNDINPPVDFEKMPPIPYATRQPKWYRQHYKTKVDATWQEYQLSRKYFLLDELISLLNSIIQEEKFNHTDLFFRLAFYIALAEIWLEKYVAMGKNDDLLYAEKNLKTKEMLEISNILKLIGEGDSEEILAARSIRAHGRLLIGKYQTTNKLSYLDEAISTLSKAAKFSMYGTSRDISLSYLASALYFRYERSGETDNLEKMIVLSQELSSVSSLKTPQRIEYLMNLGYGLTAIYSLRGNLSELHRAISLMHEALDITLPDTSIRAKIYNMLGNSLLQLYFHTNKLIDLEEALAAFKGATNIMPLESPNSVNYYINLSKTYLLRYQLSNKVDDLIQARNIGERIYSRSLTLNLHRDESSHNLALSYFEAYKINHKHKFLERALRLVQESANLVSEQSPKYPNYMKVLAQYHYERYKAIGNSNDLKLAFNTWRKGCEIGMITSLTTVIETCKNWGEVAFERYDWEEAILAYNFGMSAIDILFKNQFLRSSKEAWLAPAQKIHVLLAYALIQNHKLEEAVITLEKGRARLLLEGLERVHYKLDCLPSLGYADLYQQYTNIAGILQELEEEELFNKRINAEVELGNSINNIRKKFDETISMIQQIEGFENIFEAIDIDDIKATLIKDLSSEDSQSIAIYFIANHYGSLALIIHNDGIEVTNIDVTQAFLKSLLQNNELFSPFVGVAPVQAKEVLDKLLPIIGKKILQPVVEVLNNIERFSDKIISSVILIPTELFTLLPLHAAPISSEHGTLPLSECYDVSYTTSIRTLNHCVQKLKSQTSESYLLAISNPKNKLESLEFANMETKEAASLFSNSKRLSEEKANRIKLEENLVNTTHLHFACHGNFIPDDPLNSGLFLSDNETLTIADMLTHPELKKLRLAVLSACQTALSDSKSLPEESIGLPSAFIQAGIPGVLGTMWSVNDLSTALLMSKFYEQLLAKQISPAQALRLAQNWLREVTAMELASYFAKPKSMINLESKNMWRRFAAMEPEAKPFAHTYYWAAFIFAGV